MAQIDVAFSIDLSDDEAAALCATFDCKPGDLQAKLALYGRASLREYVCMFTGSRIFSKASDYEEERLIHLVEDVFGGSIPTEREICDHLHSTPSHSRTLVTNVVAKFRRRLDGAITDTLRKVVSQRIERDGQCIIVVRCKEMVDALNRIVRHEDASLTLVTPRIGSAAEYIVEKSVLNVLMDKLGVAK